MILRPTITTQTYQTKNHFFIDIVTKPLEFYYEAWIYNDQYGIKDLMFGVPTEQQSYDKFLEIIENNLDEYIEYYVDEHFTYEEREKYYAENNYIQSR